MRCTILHRFPRAGRVALAFAAVALALTIAEIALRRSSRASDHLSAGMTLYDSTLGWTLAAGWGGTHEHRDFVVRYGVSRHGCRLPDTDGTASPVAFVGDSFVFGTGVDDDHSFVARLGSRNFGVPGYSTDQEVLLIRDRVLAFEPSLVVLVVYLGNDLFDNQLAWPLQAPHGKPYFELKDGELELRNVPVPPTPKPADVARRVTLTSVVRGEGFQPSGAERFLGDFEVYRLLDRALGTPPDIRKELPARFAPTVELFEALIGEAERLCLAEKARLAVVLMPGQSFVTRSGSISEQYQDVLRTMILDAKLPVPVIDLASALRSRWQDADPKPLWYHPNEGHPNAEGHRVIADLLAPDLQRLLESGE